MHELSIATSIIKTAENELEKIGKGSILEIHLEIGKLAGVEIQSLNFIWEQCCVGSVLENSKVVINEPKGMAKCAECNHEYELKQIYDFCPKCNSPFKEIISGKELKIKKIIINEN